MGSSCASGTGKGTGAAWPDKESLAFSVAHRDGIFHGESWRVLN